MANTRRASASTLSSFDILIIGGYALFCAWLLITFFWLFCDFPAGSTPGGRDFTQLWLFVGFACGYCIQHLAGRRSESFNVFNRRTVIPVAIANALLPVSALLFYASVPLPFPLLWLFGFVTGVAGSFANIAWLDIFSRTGRTQYDLYCALGFIGGGILFALGAAAPGVMQPIFALVCATLSFILTFFISRRTKDVDFPTVDDEEKESTWRFAREIEPSFFMFGVVFAFTFVYLFNTGRNAVLLGLMSAIAGGVIIALLSLNGITRRTNITTYQRILVALTVGSCVLMPLVPTGAQIVLCCVIVAANAILLVINESFVLRKCSLDRTIPVFRQAPLRLLSIPFGFACGWACAAIISVFFGTHAGAFMYMRLFCALLLVVVIMIFLPVDEHHAADGTIFDAAEQAAAPNVIVEVTTTESDLLKARCQAVTKLYQLSPREEDVLEYLARGRNAAYIQEKLTISPHTVKSHIYNIYRKLDIHSQQKLMDFVETFPLDDQAARKIAEEKQEKR